jgi:hypothetical protein
MLHTMRLRDRSTTHYAHSNFCHSSDLYSSFNVVLEAIALLEIDLRSPDEITILLFWILIPAKRLHFV